MSGKEEEVVPDNKTVLRDALASLDLRSRKAPATDEVCRASLTPCADPQRSPAPVGTAQDHVTHAFWDTQPVPSLSESTEDLDDSEMGTAAL